MVYLFYGVDVNNKFLFVCSVNMLRSPTAEHVARTMGYSADSAGTVLDLAVRPLTLDAINRAEYIICMEMRHNLKVLDMAPHRGADTFVWNIPDDYNYCDPVLITILQNYIGIFAKNNLRG